MCFVNFNRLSELSTCLFLEKFRKKKRGRPNPPQIRSILIITNTTDQGLLMIRREWPPPPPPLHLSHREIWVVDNPTYQDGIVLAHCFVQPFDPPDRMPLRSRRGVRQHRHVMHTTRLLLTMPLSKNESELHYIPIGRGAPSGKACPCSS